MSSDDIFTLPLQHFISSSYEKALDEFKKIYNSSSNDESIKILSISYIGSCLIELGRFSEAEDILSEGINVKSNSFDLKFKIGIAYFKNKKFVEADKSFRSALISSSSFEERQRLLLWQSKTSIELNELHLENQKKVGFIKFSSNWYQSKEAVVITLDCNVSLSKHKTEVKIENKSIFIFVDDIQAYDIQLSNFIVPEKSSFKVLSQKIEISLFKEIDFTWVNLDTKSASYVQSYPSSYKNKVDFNAVDREIAYEMRNEKPEGNEAMMKLFQEIYSNANEETRRAMMKSYATSGGTVLSTNWGEVKDKDYEGKDRPTAPDGQEWVDEKKK
jgi:suppressor of G2 allele of SKP1